VVFSMVPAGVGVSAATEAGLAGEKAAGVAGVSPALLSVMHMGGDLDSLVFAQVLRAVAAELIGVAGEHVAARAGFSGAQSLAATTAVASEAMRAAATTI
jgi:hypothetical protein